MGDALTRESAREPTPFGQLSERTQTHLLKIVAGAEVLSGCALCNSLAKHGWLVYQGEGRWLALDPAEQRGV